MSIALQQAVTWSVTEINNNDDRPNTPWGETRPDYGRGEVRQCLIDKEMTWHIPNALENFGMPDTFVTEALHKPVARACRRHTDTLNRAIRVHI